MKCIFADGLLVISVMARRVWLVVCLVATLALDPVGLALARPGGRHVGGRDGPLHGETVWVCHGAGQGCCRARGYARVSLQSGSDRLHVWTVQPDAGSGYHLGAEGASGACETAISRVLNAMHNGSLAMMAVDGSLVGVHWSLDGPSCKGLADVGARRG